MPRARRQEALRERRCACRYADKLCELYLINLCDASRPLLLYATLGMTLGVLSTVVCTVTAVHASRVDYDHDYHYE